jgi:kynurenine formamidase
MEFVQKKYGRHWIGYMLKPMDIVLIETGVAACYGQPGCQAKHTGMTREATLWLAD